MSSIRTKVIQAIAEVVSQKKDELYVLIKESFEKESFRVEKQLAETLRKDISLFEKIFHGTLKEWFWLESLLEYFAEKNHSSIIQKSACLVGAYQIMFLDRIPSHAVFAELKLSFKDLKISDPQFKFAHAFLKKIEQSKKQILLDRKKLFETMDESFWTNPKPLLDALTLILPEERAQAGSLPKAKKRARLRALNSLKQQNQELPLFGYSLEDSRPIRFEMEKSESFYLDLKEGKTRVQGLSSQKSCEVFAELVYQKIKANKGQKKVRILEMSTGKGGKCIRTLNLLQERLKKEKNLLLEWVAADSHLKQIKVFNSETLPLIEKRFHPWASAQCIQENWSEPSLHEKRFSGFDFIWIDAPCTGFGTIAKNPQILFLRGEQAFEEATKMALLQRQLCSVALGFNPSTLFYSVCTMTKPETLDIEAFLSESLEGKKHKLTSHWIWPDETHEGFYFAYLEK